MEHRREWFITDLRIVLAVVETSRWLGRCPRQYEVARRHRESKQLHPAGCARTIRNHAPELDLRGFVGVVPGMDPGMCGRLWGRWQGRNARKLSSYVAIREQNTRLLARLRLEWRRGW